MARRRKKAGRPKLENVPREPNGRIQRARRPHEERAVVLTARCRQMGWLTPEEAQRLFKRALMPHMGCEVGRSLERALEAGMFGDVRENAEKSLDEIWSVVCRIHQVYRTYFNSICAPYPYPKIASITVLPEPFETGGVEVGYRSSDMPKTEEERVKDAAKAMMNMEFTYPKDVLRIVLNDWEVKPELLKGFVQVLRGTNDVR